MELPINSIGSSLTHSRPVLPPPPLTGEAREVVVYSGALKADDIKAFVTAEKMPLTIEFNSGNSDKIFNSGIKKQARVFQSDCHVVISCLDFSASHSRGGGGFIGLLWMHWPPCSLEVVITAPLPHAGHLLVQGR